MLNQINETKNYSLHLCNALGPTVLLLMHYDLCLTIYKISEMRKTLVTISFNNVFCHLANLVVPTILKKERLNSTKADTIILV